LRPDFGLPAEVQTIHPLVVLQVRKHRLDGTNALAVRADGLPKQFFTEAKLREALGPGFEILHISKRQSLRYGAAKSVWDFAARLHA